MIRCSHCGKLAPAGALSCQNCGMPLASGGMASTGPTEQQELPAWLESLRAHERPPASGQGDRQPFSMDELVDENSMPHWMRRNQPGVSESGNSDAFPVLPPDAQPGAQGQAPLASGLTAGSLIDEQSLPSWMRHPQDGAQPVAGQSFSAHSLVDQQSLPPWIKELGQSGPVPAAPAWPAEHGLPAPVTPPALSRIASVPQTPPVQGYTPDQGFAAHDLIDQRELPAWMKDMQGSELQNRPVPTQAGFSAGELIDQRSLPKWMQEQPGQQKTGPLPARGVPVNGSGQVLDMGQGRASTEGMPASTFIDMDSLPPWMREGEQGNASEMAAQGRMAAGSLIDQSALPQWLRNAENEQVGMAGAPSASATGPARGEGIRVPGRPRTEAGTQEQSEAAANVFSSMLGVAASSPVISGQVPASNLGVVQGQQMPPQQILPGWQSPSPAERGVPSQAWRAPGQAAPASALPTSTAYAPGSQVGTPAGMQTGRGEQSPYTGFSPIERAGSALAPGIGSTSSGRVPATDTRKKGFFDAIREFFFK